MHFLDFLGSISNDAEANLNSCRYRLDDHQRAAQRIRIHAARISPCARMKPVKAAA